MRARLVVVAIGIVALLIVWAIGVGHRKGASQPVGGVIRVSFVSSPEKESLIKPLVDRFNSTAPVRLGQRRIRVDLQIVNSGDAESQIVGGELRPIAWSPASSLWGRLLNFEAGQSWVPAENPSIVRTPLVIAMWESLARRLGWPNRQIGFSDVVRLATSSRELGQLGRFKYAHTDPYKSTSGLEAIAAEYYAAARKRARLTQRDVNAPAVQRTIRELEHSIVQYGDTTLYFEQQLPRYGPSYASAVAMEETTLVAINKCLELGSAPPCRGGVSVGVHGDRLVALYPPEGSFSSDDPLIVLNAAWVSPEQRAAAAAFGRWLRAHVTAARAAEYGFRPSNPRAATAAPTNAAYGVDLTKPPAELPLPDPSVLATLRSDWQASRRPANVVLVVDTSASMGQSEKLGETEQALAAFVKQLPSNYRVGVVSFGDQAFENAPLTLLDQGGRATLQSVIAKLTFGGEHALHDATSDALGLLQRLADPSRINAAVVLSDGGDTSSQLQQLPLLRRLSAAREPRLPVVVYTIAYGANADRSALSDIAIAAEGNEFDAGPGLLDSTYRMIASYL
jgi:Ca-activated chloride channel family protein